MNIRQAATQLLVIAISACVGWVLCIGYAAAQRETVPPAHTATYDEEIAADAQALLLLHFRAPLHGKFSSLICPIGSEDKEWCWDPFLREFIFDGHGGYRGTLTVHSAFDSSPLARARAKWAAVMIADLCSEWRVLYESVNVVQILDAAGKVIAADAGPKYTP